MTAAPTSQRCPGCPAVYKTGQLKVGQKFRCVKCQTIVVVGAPAPAARAVKPPPAAAASGGASATRQSGIEAASPRASSSGVAPAPPRKSASGVGPATSPSPGPPDRAPAPVSPAPPSPPAATGGDLFSIPDGDDEVDLLDESGAVEDLASALVAGSAKKAAAEEIFSEGAPTQAGLDRRQPAEAAAPAAPGTPASAATGGLTIAGYRVGEAIGKGGMATVYKGVQESLNRPVAIKVLDADLAQNPAGVARFKKEAAVLSALSHASIVGIIDTGMVGDQPYLVMEYVAGTNLRYLMEKVRVPMDKLIGYVQQVLTALDYAHQKGVIHRDVKPENVIIGRDQSVKLADFGVAGLAHSTITQAEGVQGLTKTSTSLGTQNYVAPEQLKNARQAGPPADVYSVGVLLYEILTGELPVGAFEPPSSLNPNVPPVFDRLIMKALRRAPDQRFPSAQAMSDAIRAALEGGDASAATSVPQAPPAASGGLDALVPKTPGPSLPPSPPASSSPSSAPGNRRISAEAQEALRREQERKREEEAWKVWQQGQQEAKDFREGVPGRSSGGGGPADAGSLAEQARRQKAQEQKKKDEEFRKKWEARKAAERSLKPNPYLRQIPALIGTLVGLVLLIAVLDLHVSFPFLRKVPFLVDACESVRGVLGL